MRDTALPVLDAHQHFWDLAANDYPWLRGPEKIAFRYGDYAPLCKNYLPAEYRRDTAGCNIVGTVHMEAEIAHDAAVGETRWLTALAARDGLPMACVAQARLDQPDVAAVLAAQAAQPLVRGVRHKPTAAASPGRIVTAAPGGMDDPVWRRGYALLAGHGLSFDLQVPWWHAAEAARLAADFPDTLLIINHSFLPADRSADGLAGWRCALETVAGHPNVRLKISGLGLAGRPWRAAENVPLMRDAIAIIGWQHCLFASNFPVDRLVGSFADILAGFRQAIADRPEPAQCALLHDNAAKIYRLQS